MTAPVPALAPRTPVELRGTTYYLELLRGAELARALPLFHDAFHGRSFTADWLRRKYASVEGGVAAFLCVAFAEDGTAAGSVGMLPARVRYGDRVEVAGQMVDVATANAYRGRGLFVQLAETVRELCTASGMGFLFGFPNDEAYPIWTNKLGYAHVGDLIEYRTSTRALWLERVARRAGVTSLYEGYAAAVLGRRAAGGSALPNSLASEGAACVVRDAAVYAYKHDFARSRVVEVSGGRVWLNTRHGLLLGDIEAQTREGTERTVRALRGIAGRLGLHQIVFQASRGTRFESTLEGLFAHSPGLPVIHLPLTTQIPADRLRFSFGDVDNY